MTREQYYDLYDEWDESDIRGAGIEADDDYDDAIERLNRRAYSQGLSSVYDV